MLIQMTEKTRVKELGKLIADEQELNFNPQVIQLHQSQLDTLKEILRVEYIKRKAFRDSLKFIKLEGGIN